MINTYWCIHQKERMTLTLIGDCHGKYADYLKAIEPHENTLQIGDFGFNYDVLDQVDSDRHKLFFGNHDNYDLFPDVPHNIGNYGMMEHGGVEFFWTRGAFSIDWQDRCHDQFKLGRPKSWWEEEQLKWPELQEAVDQYREHKPKIMISHTCPHTVAQTIGSPGILVQYGFDPWRFTTVTQQCFEVMINVHQPKYWYFGHFHRSRELEYLGTKFRCIAELESLTI